VVVNSFMNFDVKSMENVKKSSGIKLIFFFSCFVYEASYGEILVLSVICFSSLKLHLHIICSNLVEMRFARSSFHHDQSKIVFF
jgi:hypothetical protein